MRGAPLPVPNTLIEHWPKGFRIIANWRPFQCEGGLYMRLITSVVLCALAVGLCSTQSYSAPSGGNAHAPITIQSDADFEACACVLGGNGTHASPYIIGPWAINKYAGAAVSIDGANLTKSFVLLNLTIAGNGGSTSQGIVLTNINPSGTQSIVAQVKGTQTSINSAEVGIIVESSNYVTLDGGGATAPPARAPSISRSAARSTSRTAATYW